MAEYISPNSGDVNVPFDVPGYADIVDGPQAFKNFADSVATAVDTASDHANYTRFAGSVAASTATIDNTWDSGLLCAVNYGTSVTLTVGPSAWPNSGYTYNLVQYGAGQFTLVPGAGVTLYSAAGLKSRAQFSVVTLVLLNHNTNTWLVYGDTVA